MVHLNRIYTKSGDAGETSLGSGQRIPKTDPRIIAYGGIDGNFGGVGYIIPSEFTTGDPALSIPGGDGFQEAGASG